MPTRIFLLVATLCALSPAARAAPAAPLLATSALAMSSTSLRLDLGLLADVKGAIDTVRATVAAGSVSLVPLTPVLDGLAATSTPTVPAHYAWIERDTRAFWYAAGAGAVTTLGVHILGGIPTLALGGSLVSSLFATGVGFPAATAVGFGLFIAYSAAEAAVSGLVATLVFNSLSTTYEASYLSGFLGHFAGGLAATTVTTLTFGGGLLLFHGMGLLTEFTGGAGISSLQIFTFLGAMPAVVIAGTALIAVPALATAWALAAGANPRAGFEIDDAWQAPTVQSRTEDPTRARQVGTVAVQMPLSIPLPVP